MLARMRAATVHDDLFATSAPRVEQPWTDAEGGVRLWRDAVPAARAATWFDALQATVPWQAQRRPMYDRVVDVPRLLASYALDGPVADAGHALVAEILAGLRAAFRGEPAMRDLAAVPFDSVGLNLYRDGRDSVAMHNDTLRHLAPGQPIVVLSLGAERRMTLRAKPAPRASVAFDLRAGDVVAMSHASQSTHDHGIAKTTREVGPRISLAFRVRAG